MELTVESMRRVDAHELYVKFVSQQVRPDGRGLLKGRRVTVTPHTIATANGSSVVRLGATNVVCGIKAEVAVPLVATPTEGYVVPNVDLSPLCSSKYRPGPPSDAAQVLSETLARVFAR